MSTTPNLEHIDLLAQLDLFLGLDRLALARIVGSLERRALADAELVVRQGDVADGLYIVTQGRLTVSAAVLEQDGETRLATLLAGDYFGEMGLLLDAPRSATVRANGLAEVLRLERGRFLELVQQHPGLGLAVARTLVGRVRSADRDRLEGDQAVRRATQAALARLSPERQRRMLEAGVLERPTSASLHALFGSMADEVARDLADIGVSAEPAGERAFRALRTLCAHELGPHDVRVLAARAADQLQEAGAWDSALGVLACYGSRPALLDTLRAALSARPALASSEVQRWLGEISDDEVRNNPELVVTLARWHAEQGEPAWAARLIERPLAAPAGVVQPVVELGRRRRTGTGSRTWRPPPARAWHAAFWPTGRVLAALCAAALTTATLVAPVGGAQAQWRFLGLLAAAAVLWASELMPASLVGLTLVAALIVAGVAAPAQALAGFGSTDWLFVLAIFGVSAAVERSGLLFRLGLQLVRKLRRGLFGQAVGLLVAGMGLLPVLPNTYARVTLMTRLAQATSQALQLKDREPGAALLGLTAWIATGPMYFLVLNASPLNLLLWGLLPAASRAHFSWGQWLLASLPLGVCVAAGSVVMLLLVLKPRDTPPPPGDRLTVQLAVLGPPSRRELTILVVVGLVLAGWTAGPAVGIDAGTVAVLGLCGLFAAKALDRAALNDLPWDTILFYGVVLSLGRLATNLGVDQLAASIVGAPLRAIGMPAPLFVFLVAGLTMAVRLVLLGEQATLLINLALIPLAPTLGVDPWVVVITSLATGVMWYIPALVPSYALAYHLSDGQLYSVVQGRRASFGYAVVVLIGLALSLPYWRLLGLI